jgi:hypothetical protein
MISALTQRLIGWLRGLAYGCLQGQLLPCNAHIDGLQRCCCCRCFAYLQANLQTDPTNCGTCGKQCALSVMYVQEVICSGGKCDYTTCVYTYEYEDCNDDRSDGCEVGSTAAVDLQQQQQQLTTTTSSSSSS